MNTKVPDGMPTLSQGKHHSPNEGACVMEYISILAGEPFTDLPRCTNPFLARLAHTVNDNYTNNRRRERLLELIPRLMRTGSVASANPTQVSALMAKRLLADSRMPRVTRGILHGLADGHFAPYPLRFGTHNKYYADIWRGVLPEIPISGAAFLDLAIECFEELAGLDRNSAPALSDEDLAKMTEATTGALVK